MGFSAPSGAEQFYATVVGRVTDLLDIGIWDIEQERLSAWLKQFQGREETYLAACLLDSLLYRSDSQFIASAKNLLRGALRWACHPAVSGESDVDLLSALQSAHDPGVRLVPVIRDGDPPTKSGPLVLRNIKRSMTLNTQWMQWPWSIAQTLSASSSIHTIIFVDDFLASGQQFFEFLSVQRIDLTHPSTKWIYAPIVAHADGLKYLEKQFPSLEVLYSELLDTSNGFFDDQRWQAMSQGTITGNEARAYYVDFLQRRNIDARGAPEGFANLALCFGFSHGTPDNSLPILWSQSNYWHSLLER